MRRRTTAALSVGLLVMTVLELIGEGACLAGMPSPLPTNWTQEFTPSWAPSRTSVGVGGNSPRWEAISFFVAVILLSAWGLKSLWNVVRRDFPSLPALGYAGALGWVTLWGLLFVIVLTMISGARELMTPGAWRKQGWTYTLANPESLGATASYANRRQALEQLRNSLWQYAATHHGEFPPAGDDVLGSLDVPDWPGVSFQYVGGQKAEDAGRLLVYEPEIDRVERLVLLTNGFLGTMRSSEIERALNVGESP